MGCFGSRVEADRDPQGQGCDPLAEAVPYSSFDEMARGSLSESKDTKGRVVLVAKCIITGMACVDPAFRRAFSPQAGCPQSDLPLEKRTSVSSIGGIDVESSREHAFAVICYANRHEMEACDHSIGFEFMDCSSLCCQTLQSSDSQGHRTLEVWRFVARH
jgi:hypothetical protein